MFLRKLSCSHTPLIRLAASLSQLVASKNWPGLISSLDQPSQPLDLQTLEKALWGMCASRKITMAYRLFLRAAEFNIAPTEQHYTALIECAIRADKPILAANLYYQSQLFGIELDGAVTNELLIELMKAGAGVENLKKVVERMKKDELEITASTNAKLLKLCIRLGEWQFANEVTSYMHQHKQEIPHKVPETHMSVTSQSSDFKAFQRLYQQLKETDEGPEASGSLFAHRGLEASRMARNPLSFKLIMTPGSQAARDEFDDDETEAESEDSDSDDSD